MPAFYKTVLILETPFWVAGAAESVKMSRIGIGASNKSGRRHVGSLAGSSRPLKPSELGREAAGLIMSVSVPSSKGFC